MYILLAEPNFSQFPGELGASGKIQLVDIDTSPARVEYCNVLVGHSEFFDLDEAQFMGKMIVDTRGIWKC